MALFRCGAGEQFDAANITRYHGYPSTSTPVSITTTLSADKLNFVFIQLTRTASNTVWVMYKIENGVATTIDSSTGTQTPADQLLPINSLSGNTLVVQNNVQADTPLTVLAG